MAIQSKSELAIMRQRKLPENHSRLEEEKTRMRGRKKTTERKTEY